MSAFVNENCPLDYVSRVFGRPEKLHSQTRTLTHGRSHDGRRNQHARQSIATVLICPVWPWLLFRINRFNATLFSLAFIIKIINLRLQRKIHCIRPLHIEATAQWSRARKSNWSRKNIGFMTNGELLSDAHVVMRNNGRASSMRLEVQIRFEGQWCTLNRTQVNRQLTF